MVFICLNLLANKYYVKNSGNDSNTGLSDSNAWAHHPWMSSWTGNINLAPGDTVFMKRGDSWTIADPEIPFMIAGQSGSTGNPITTTAYGTGFAPLIKILTASDQPVVYISGKSYLVFDNLHVQHYNSTYAPNRNGFVLVNVCHNLTFTNNEIDNIPYCAIQTDADSYYITVGDTTATNIATSSSYSNNIHDFGYGGIILLGVDPVTKTSHFSVYYNYVHDATQTSDGDNEYGIAFSANSSSTAWPKYATARYNRVENIQTWEGFDIHGGSYIYFIDNYVKNFGAIGILIACKAGLGNLPATSNNLFIERNIIEQPVSGWVTGHENSFICQFPDGSNPSTNVFIRDNTLFYTSRPSIGSFFGIRVGGTNGVTISGNKIYNGSTTSGKAGIYIGFNEGSTGNFNTLVTDNFISNWGTGIEFVGSSLNSSAVLSTNIIAKPSKSASLYVSGDEIPASGSLSIFNNSFLSNSDYSNIVEISSGLNKAGSISFKNNLLGFLSSYPGIYFYIGNPINGTFSCDNNLYWGSNYPTPFYINGVLRNWTFWTTSLGYDGHGIGPDTNPLFQDYSGSYLQDIDFELQKASPAIDDGTDVGLTSDYAGNPISGPPDIGAYEYQSQQSAAVPVYVSSSVENDTPTNVSIVYNLSLANINPATAAFTVNINSVARTISSVAVAGTTITLTLASPVAYGDVVTVAYTKPSTNPLQTSAGGQAESFTAQTVINNVSPPVPVYLSSAIQNATPSKLDMTYSLALGNTIPAVTAFSVTVNSAARTVSAVSVSVTTVSLTLASPVAYGDVVTVAYTKPSTNPLQTSAGGQAASFTAQTVTNNISPPVPVYLSSAIQNATPSKLDMTYSLALGNTIPAATDFSVTVNSAARTVSAVAVSGTTVSLTIASPVVYGDVVTVSYTIPSSNPLQTSAGGQAASFSAQNVTNNVAAIAVPVYVSSAVENATPAILNTVYSLSLANSVPAASAFTVTVNSASRTVSSVAVSGTTVSLTLASAVAYGDAVTVAYTQPSSNPLQTSAGGQVASFSAQKVTNNVASVTTVTAPVYVSSSVENATPTKLNIVYSLSLANTVPASSAFSVTVNSVSRTVNSVAVSGTTITLTLSSAVIYGDVVTVAYTKPSSNPLQTSAGGQAASFIAQTVANNVQLSNSPPVVMVNYESTSYSGFVNELDASGSYDPDKDNLTFSWVVPSDIPVSSTTGSVIKYLSPASDATQKVQFVLNVSDGKTTTSKTIPVEINPYEPGLDVAEVAKVEASSYSAPNYPSNIIDGNIGTMWAANGDDQWLLLTLKEEFSVQYVDIAFESGQAKESFFDIMGSDDMNTWETILTKSNSCAFSGALQTFDFPASKTANEFKYIKIIGHGNSTDTWNYISEFRIFGYKHKSPTSYEEQPVKIYPNPASNYFNVRIDETSVVYDFLRIISLTGKVLLQHKIDPGVTEFSVAISLLKGVYLIEIGSENVIDFCQKLVVSN